MSDKVTLHVAAFLLTVVSAGHLIRSIAGWEVQVHTWIVPVWLSILAFALAGVLAYQLWKMAK